MADDLVIRPLREADLSDRQPDLSTSIRNVSGRARSG
ncbi:Uncharacterised protein [Mycobacterium xenopi]|uniref:Uncharacterized protein n=1 Tax=Mycobacterium xenopi TaxID=1789 RepID=A0AAD1M2W6_MYCXE|nr:hypothetical protein MYXE_44430 [Mycobacterium xenopi]SPX90056.1 Uncharacterised protein [Mycobacterium xenopi]